MATLEEVKLAEEKELEEIRKRMPSGTRLPGKTVGLAFSGGGIRSATFHLGVLQALAEYGLLKRFDYLSTVSGGGYIGSWLTRWIHEKGIAKVEEALPGGSQEAPQVDFLRDFSNYLTPRVGLTGADTWAAIAIYLRNLLLNQTILITFLGALLLIPWMVSAGFKCLENGFSGGPKFEIFTILTAVLLTMAIAFGVMNTSTCGGRKEHWYTSEERVLLLVVAPLFTGAVLLSYALWSIPGLWTPLFSMLAGVIVYGGGHLAGWIWTKTAYPEEATCAPEVSVVLWAIPAGIFAGFEVYWLSFVVYHWKSAADATLGVWHTVSWGTPLVVVAFFLAGTLHIGLAKFALRNEMQEWWARLGGWLMLCTIFWCALFGIALFTPLGVKLLATDEVQRQAGAVLHGLTGDHSTLPTKILESGIFKRAALIGWLIHSAYGLYLGWSKTTSGKSPGSPHTTSSAAKEIIAKAAPFVFVAGLLILVACGLESAAIQMKGVDLITGEYNSWWFIGAFGLLLAISLFLSWRVDINRFSMNLVYRNRIIRCYLGASNANRKPQPFTGFDSTDDLPLASIVAPLQAAPAKKSVKGAPPATANQPETPKPPFDGPYPILNATLDISHGERLGWQERKAEAFMFTPRYCGYDFPEMRPNINQVNGAAKGAYQPTETWGFARGGITLGTAVSISGAAVSPNMGYHTYAPLAFLMTVFNVRLGVWLANPRYSYSNEKYKPRPDGGPGLSLLYLLNELMGSATDSSKYVYLSDGAHFENLALYELVRRKCDFIIAGDAGEDPEYGFGDLVNAIRKCRTDFGAEIQLTLGPWKLPGENGCAGAHAIFGTIKYADRQRPGQLLYIKTSLTKDDPEDLLAYKRAHGSFPHQTTADQWFDESQFESYRMLGRRSLESIVKTMDEKAVRKCGIPALFPELG